MMYASDQTSFRNEGEDQTKATPTMDYKTLKAIRAGKSILLPLRDYYAFESQLTTYAVLMEMLWTNKNRHVKWVWKILDAFAAPDQTHNEIPPEYYSKVTFEVVED